jgi:hypothetical protein
MRNANEWRGRFIELVDGLHRELSVVPPARNHDDESALVLSVQLDGTSFELTHEPSPCPERLMLECRLGHIGSATSHWSLEQLLYVNHELSHEAGAAFGADLQSGEVIYGICLSLAHMLPTSLVEQMKSIANLATNWRDTMRLAARTFEDAQALGIAGRA